MNISELSTFIEALTKRDTKTLAEKGCKMSEETGELNRAILAYSGSAGANHRLPNIAKVQEECADCILVALSTALSTGGTWDSLLAEIERKARYWETLQNNEAAVDLNKLPFEIHITVEAPDDLNHFREMCTSLGVKMIALDLVTRGSYIIDVMTSSVIIGTTLQANNEAARISLYLSAAGFKVLRTKIETIPDHPHAAHNAMQNVSDRYFEAHFAYRNIEKNDLAPFANSMCLHLSQNRMKRGFDSVVMATLRVSTPPETAETFRKKVANVIAMSKAAGLDIATDKQVIEYALYDDHVRLDAEWIG